MDPYAMAKYPGTAEAPYLHNAEVGKFYIAT